MILECAGKLGEHFEAVQIHVSWMDETGSGNTTGEHGGCGNWYARFGLAQEFIDRGKAWEIGDAVARATKDD